MGERSLLRVDLDSDYVEKRKPTKKNQTTRKVFLGPMYKEALYLEQLQVIPVQVQVFTPEVLEESFCQNVKKYRHLVIKLVALYYYMDWVAYTWSWRSWLGKGASLTFLKGYPH